MKNFKYTRDSDGFIIAVTQQELDKFNRESYALVTKIVFCILIVVVAAFGTWKFFN